MCLGILTPNDDSDNSKSHPERSPDPGTSVAPAILDQEPPGSWEGLREGSDHPLAGGRAHSPLGDTETGPGAELLRVRSDLRPAQSHLAGEVLRLGLEFPQTSNCSTMFRTLFKATQFRLICRDREVSGGTVSRGGAQ